MRIDITDAKRARKVPYYIRQLDGLLCQLEDSGTVTNTDIAEARDLLVRIGFGDKELSALADHYENL